MNTEDRSPANPVGPDDNGRGIDMNANNCHRLQAVTDLNSSPCHLVVIHNVADLMKYNSQCMSPISGAPYAINLSCFWIY